MRYIVDFNQALKFVIITILQTPYHKVAFDASKEALRLEKIRKSKRVKRVQ